MNRLDGDLWGSPFLCDRIRQKSYFCDMRLNMAFGGEFLVKALFKPFIASIQHPKDYVFYQVHRAKP